MLTALQTLEACVQANETLDQLAADLTVYPQLLVNVRVKEKKALDQMPRVQDRDSRLRGRLNRRASPSVELRDRA